MQTLAIGGMESPEVMLVGRDEKKTKKKNTRRCSYNLATQEEKFIFQDIFEGTSTPEGLLHSDVAFVSRTTQSSDSIFACV